ncbi:MAG TPA: hypothetical protein VF152_11160 [Acidimicrobiia bacterium]
MRDAMFLYDFLTLERPYPAVADVLVNDRGAGALTRAVVATAEAERRGGADAMLFEVGTVRSVDGTVVVPIRWTPGPGHSAFQHLEGSLHVEPFGPDSSYLSLSASWDEPTTGLGRREDTRRRQREAEMNVRSFLRELANALQDTGPGGHANGRDTDPPSGSPGS